MRLAADHCSRASCSTCNVGVVGVVGVRTSIQDVQDCAGMPVCRGIRGFMKALWQQQRSSPRDEGTAEASSCMSEVCMACDAAPD